MRRFLLIPALAAFVGGALLVGDAGACCHKKKMACAPAPCAPAPVVECVPPPAPAPVPVAECAPVKKKCCFGHFKMPKFGGFCHKKAACAPAPVQCAAPAPAPCAPCGAAAPMYAAPMTSPQGMPSGQA